MPAPTSSTPRPADSRPARSASSIPCCPPRNGACYTHAKTITPSARSHRNTLCCAMPAAGFVNRLTEWWHFSRGCRYWAFNTT
ncbi:M15 family metallopeptidase [Streptomyces sp. NPDC048641]|uniref:M15 family metallopeptidase n=1 Tax=Streptomyces sp. NPDC048641 TaxID=3154825 RepID=UPI0034187BCD